MQQRFNGVDKAIVVVYYGSAVRREFEHHLDLIRGELRFWQGFGKSLLSQKLTEFYNLLSSEPQVKRSETVKGRFLKDKSFVGPLDEVTSLLLNDNPEQEIEVFFPNYGMEIRIVNPKTSEYLSLKANHPDELYIEAHVFKEERKEIEEDLSTLSPFQNFTLARTLVEVLSEKFQVENPQEVTTKSS